MIEDILDDSDTPRFEELLKKRLGVEIGLVWDDDSTYVMAVLAPREERQLASEAILEWEGEDEDMVWYVSPSEVENQEHLNALKRHIICFVSWGRMTLRTRPDSSISFSVCIPEFSSLSELRMKTDLFKYGKEGGQWTN